MGQRLSWVGYRPARSNALLGSHLDHTAEDGGRENNFDQSYAVSVEYVEILALMDYALPP
jgi:hypothetical protein